MVPVLDGRGPLELDVLLSALLGLCFAPLCVRFGSAEITPPEPLPLGGYTARGGKLCELPGDKLEARALILEQGETRIAVVACDLLTIPESLYAAVRKTLPANTHLFLSATHTHCAPDSQMLNARMDFSLPGIARYNPKWEAWYASRITASINKAISEHALRFEELVLARGYRELNRGRRAMAVPDRMAYRILGSRDQPFLTWYTAHAVLYGPAENRPRTDFPGLIRGEQGLFLPGAIGDMSPSSTGNSPAEQVSNFAQKFLAGKWSREVLETSPLRWVSVPIALDPVQNAPEFARQNRIPESFAESIVKRFAPTEGTLSVFRIGKLAIVGVPGEPTANIGRRIRRLGLARGFEAVLTVSHVNGWLGYLLEPEDYDRGGYEASLNFHGRMTGERVIEAAHKALDELAKR